MTSSNCGARSTCDDVVAARDLTGRNILITGANAGIGFETARSLASRGAHVVLVCRDRSKTADTAQRIRAAHPNALLSERPMDLASLASIRRGVEALILPKLHTLIFNAGLYAPNYVTTADGIESTVGVCHFGHFLLFHTLLDRLRAGRVDGDLRVVVVSSESHRQPPTLNLERFPMTARWYMPLIAYGQAKLCNALFANELTRRYAGEGIYANSLHPGNFIGTSIFRSSLAAKALALVASPFTKSVPQGAATTVYCATAPELAGVGGHYFMDCQQRKMSRGARDEDVAARLWAISEARIAEPDASASIAS